MCSEGTTSILGVSGDKEKQWVEAARKYNKAVDAATEQLMKDAQPILTPEQMAELKTWFDEGVNKQMNQLLGKKAAPTKP